MTKSKKTLPTVFQGKWIADLSAQEARKALQITLAQAQTQRANFLTLFTKYQNLKPPKNVQLLDNMSHEKIEDIIDFTSNNAQPYDLSNGDDFRTDVDRVINEFLEDI